MPSVTTYLTTITWYFSVTRNNKEQVLQLNSTFFSEIWLKDALSMELFEIFSTTYLYKFHYSVFIYGIYWDYFWNPTFYFMKIWRLKNTIWQLWNADFTKLINGWNPLISPSSLNLSETFLKYDKRNIFQRYINRIAQRYYFDLPKAFDIVLSKDWKRKTQINACLLLGSQDTINRLFHFC